MNPMNTKDEAFAKAVVALAREHQMGSVTMSFRSSFTVSGQHREQVSMRWAEGRHGDHSNIILECTATAILKEEPK